MADSLINGGTICHNIDEKYLRGIMKLYHTGKIEIREPDIYYGRKNADFGQGFYLTPDLDFAKRWARKDAVLNEYELNEEGLTIHRFERNEEWFNYIYHNRRAEDGISADVIIGPIANDTIFETYGLISSGYLKPEEAMKLLLVGPQFTQVAIKSEKAVSQLKWMSSEKITSLDEERRKAEQDEYYKAMEEVVRKMEEGL